VHSVDDILKACADVHPELLAVTLEDERASFGQIDRWADAYANALQGWGVRRGSPVLVISELSIEQIALHFAMARMGAIFIPANPRFSETELLAICRYLGTERLIVDAGNQDLAAAVARAVGAELAVLASEHGVSAGFNLRRAAIAAFGQAHAAERARPDDVHAIYLTSGSTGTPKGVMISHKADWLRANLNHRLASSRGVACMFPLFHMGGWQMINHAWAGRQAIHFAPRANAEDLLGTIERWGASSFYAIPAVWRRILACPKSFDTSTLRNADTGTSFVDQDLILALRERFPQAMTGIGYGSTEIGSGMWLAHEDLLDKPGSVGLPTAGVSARIDNGELLLKAATVMDGYYKLPVETAECLEDGWYRTGDLAGTDGDGYFSITGRRREVIRSGGETIAPAEVEAPLIGLDGVQEIAIVGLPDSTWGEIVCAAVVYAPGGAPISIETLKSRLTNVAKFKHPRKLVEVAQIPRTTATGQVQRETLRREIMARAPVA
jgi:acyl-CoA synthetase (AMP-forming)/AMP-acid ligase II